MSNFDKAIRSLKKALAEEDYEFMLTEGLSSRLPQSEYDYQRLFEIFGFDNAVVLLNFFEGNYPCLTQLNGNGQKVERKELENGD